MSKSLEERVTEPEKKVMKLVGSEKVNIGKNLKVGDTFELTGLIWKILDITEKGYVCFAECMEDKKQFDSSCNKWQESSLRNYLNIDFYKELAAEVGEENIIPFERDLLSLDGQTEYGTCEDRVSLLTVDEYRKYRSLIPNTGDKWWWTCTPDSKKCNDDERWITVVTPSGNVDNDFCGDHVGVRPFCIFSSAIFESGE